MWVFSFLFCFESDGVAGGTRRWLGSVRRVLAEHVGAAGYRVVEGGVGDGHDAVCGVLGCWAVCDDRGLLAVGMNGRYYDDDAGGGRFIPWCDALLVLPACYTAHWRDSDYDVDDEARFATGVCCAAAVLERWKVCPSVCWCGGASRAWCASCRGIATLLTDFRHGALTACAVLALGPAGLDAGVHAPAVGFCACDWEQRQW